MEMRYQLYTEDVNRDQTICHVSRYMRGFNVTQATGYYNGGREPALVIEILAPDTQANVIRFLAKTIGQRNNQECVLVTSEAIRAEFVS